MFLPFESNILFIKQTNVMRWDDHIKMFVDGFPIVHFVQTASKLC